MEHDQFIAAVAERAGIDRGEADVLTRATLQTLRERISGGEARDLGVELPEPLKEILVAADPEAEPFDLEEFERRVAARADYPETDVEDGVRAVFRTLREAVPEDEFDDVLAQLPDEYRPVVVAA